MAAQARSTRSARATPSAPAATPASSSSARARATTRRWRASSWSRPDARCAADQRDRGSRHVSDARRLRRHAAFHGLRRATPGVVTVGGALRGDPRAGRCGHPVELTVRRAHRRRRARVGSGRRLRRRRPRRSTSSALQRAVNRLCGPAIVVREVERRPHRRLRRPLLGHGPPLPLHGAEPGRCPTRSSPRTTWHVPTPLDLAGAAAARATRSSASTTSRRSAGKVARRDAAGCARAAGRRRRAGTTLGDGVLRFEIEANAFCHQMVRAIVGTLVEVGRGRKRAGRASPRSSRARDRASPAGWRRPTACACGRSTTRAGARLGLAAGPDFVDASFGSP